MAQCARYEPTIDEIMADPTVKALMRADRVNADRLRHRLIGWRLAGDGAETRQPADRSFAMVAKSDLADACSRHVVG